MVVTGEFAVGAVLRQLKKFHPNTRRYREEQNQNLVRPCFLVNQLKLSSEKLMSVRERRPYRIRLTYLPKLEEENMQVHLREIGESLLEEFRILTLSEKDSVFGRDLEYEVVDNELLFTAEFPVHVVHKEDPCPKMKTLESHAGYKG